MPPKQMSEARMREIIRDQFATSMNEFMANMNSGAGGPGGASGSGGAEMVRKGAVPKPPSDDEGSERPRKTSRKSDGDKGPSDPWGSPKIMPPKQMSKALMREIIRGSGGTGGNANGTGVRGTGPTVPELTRCTYATFIKCDPLPFIGTKGAVGLCQWFERLESVFQISECKENDRVKFTMATLMTEEFCPGSVVQRMEQELYNLGMKGMDIDGYTNRFHELDLLCPRMVEPEAVKVEQYIRGLAKNLHGDVTSSQPATINGARDCPKLGRNRQRGNNRRGVYQLGAVNAQEDPKVVT
nr:hypothetical protein [Tanacetum cinerariifolium]